MDKTKEKLSFCSSKIHHTKANNFSNNNNLTSVGFAHPFTEIDILNPSVGRHNLMMLLFTCCVSKD